MRNDGATRDPMPKRVKKDDPEQSKRFVETAKELDADKSVKKFDRAFKAITPVKKTRNPGR